MDQKEVNAYLKKVKSSCPYLFCKKLMLELKEDLLDFLEENPDSEVADVVEHFGAPEMFGYSYILAMEGEERGRLLKQSRRIKKTALTAAVFCVLAMAVWVGFGIWRYSESAAYSYEVWVEDGSTGEVERVFEEIIPVDTREPENVVDKK